MLQIYAFSFNLSIILLYFLAFLTPITKKTSLAADFPHLLEAISIILTSAVIFLSCLSLCHSAPCPVLGGFAVEKATVPCASPQGFSPVCCDTVATLIPPLAISPLFYSGLSSSRTWPVLDPCPVLGGSAAEKATVPCASPQGFSPVCCATVLAPCPVLDGSAIEGCYHSVRVLRFPRNYSLSVHLPAVLRRFLLVQFIAMS